MRYITIAGTGGIGRPADWDSPESKLSVFFAERGCTQLETSPLKRYMWSTDVDGINADNNTWDAAGRALAHYVYPPLSQHSLVKPEDTFIIAHSHGGNVVAYACGKYGLKVNGLVTVGMPIREDMHEVYQAAADNITRHIHIYAGWRDWWQVLGSMFDGRFGIHRTHPFAEVNKRVAKGNHGSVLRDEKFFPLWLTDGWLDFWQGPVVETVKALLDKSETNLVTDNLRPISGSPEGVSTENGRLSA